MLQVLQSYTADLTIWHYLLLIGLPLLTYVSVRKALSAIDAQTYIPLDSEAVKERCPNAWSAPSGTGKSCMLEPHDVKYLQWSESPGMETPLPFAALKVKNEEEEPVARKSALDRLNDWRKKNPNPHTLTERVRIRLLGMNSEDRQKKRKWEAKNMELSAAHTADYAERYERVNTQILQSRNRIDGLRGSIDELREIVIQCNKGGK